MGKKSIEKLYSELIKNLWNDLLFYIPNTDLAIVFVEELKHIEKDKIINRIFVMDKILGPIEYKNNGKHNILSKGTMLEDNMYLLLKKKRKFDGQEFSFVIDNYFEQAEFCFYITNWIHNDIESNKALKLNKQLYGLFQLQYQAYKKHFQKLVKHFYPKKENLPTGNFEVLTTIEKYFPELLKKYNQNEKGTGIIAKTNIPIDDIKDDSTNIPQVEEMESKTIARSKEQHSVKYKKQPAVTEQEAKKFLLKSVFGIG